MAGRSVLNVDLARVYDSTQGGTCITTLAWGDDVEVRAVTRDAIEVGTTRFERQPDGSVRPSPASGFIRLPRASRLRPEDILIDKSANRVLRVDFVDVQQGDGSVIETPAGKVVLVDGGDNQLFARYLANRYRGTSAAAPRQIDCIVVTHGDADHFVGLTRIHESERRTDHKRLFIQPRRVFHNGLVKRPGRRGGVALKESELLGPTTPAGDTLVITGLEDDLLAVPDAEMNEPFRAWKRALQAYRRRGPIELRRLSRGDDAAFDFLADDGIAVDVLGPITTRVRGVDGLKFLGAPKPRVGRAASKPGGAGSTGKSASHTINGHSIVFRLRYGDVSFLFAGDLNEEVEDVLTRAQRRGKLELRSEVFKVPHHGSADFSGAFLEAVSPVVSVVSSGDENARKEYIHPRATLVGALGKHSRTDEPLVFVTELVAFFQVEGWVRSDPSTLRHKTQRCKRTDEWFAFSRAAFGIVMVRTDGKRLLVYTNSGQTDLKEAYAFRMDAGRPVPERVRLI